MTIAITHPFVSGKSDGTDTTMVQPSNWNASHTITMAAGKILGRDTSGSGAVQELPLAYNTSTGAWTFTGSVSGSTTLSAGTTITVGTGDDTEKDVVFWNANRKVHLFLQASTGIFGLWDDSSSGTRWTTDNSGNFYVTGNLVAAAGNFSGSLTANYFYQSSSSGTVMNIDKYGSGGGYAAVFKTHETAAGTSIFTGVDRIDQSLILFGYQGGGIATVTTNSASVSYNTGSDYRRKENVTPLTGAINRLKLAKPIQHTWIGIPEIGTVDGFLAHELALVVPEAVTGAKDGVDAEGNPVYQQVDLSKAIPLLTAALLEAVSKIEALTSRVTTLEAAKT